ncbi:MAG: site-specific integrase [Saccharofermentanales bacterium]
MTYATKQITHPIELDLNNFYKTYYLPDRIRRIRENTQTNYHYMFKNRVSPILGRKILCQISPLDIRDWQNQLMTDALSESYLRKLHQFLGKIFEYAVKYYGLPSNPCTIASAIGKNRSQRIMRIWTLDEFNQVCEAIPDPIYRTQVSLLYWSGIRRGELYGLQWRDYKSSTMELAIARSYQRIHGQAIVREPKTDTSVRIITLPQHMCDLLNKHRKKSVRTDARDFIFKWTKKKLDDAIEKACRKTGIQRIRVHDLRHSHASLLVYLNVDIASISRRLGHADISTTLSIYTHAYNDTDRQIADVLNTIGS